jgi:hypothetical protein
LENPKTIRKLEMVEPRTPIFKTGNFFAPDHDVAPRAAAFEHNHDPLNDP